MSQLPLVHELNSPLDPFEAFLKIQSLGGVLFLDSALKHSKLGRYSFITADPFDEYSLSIDNESELDGANSQVQDPFAELEEALARWKQEAVTDLPPFQGGLAGLFSYDLGRALERLPPKRKTPFPTPDYSVGAYDWVLAYDHALGKAWIISQGFPEIDLQGRAQRAQERIDQVLDLLRAPTPPLSLSHPAPEFSHSQWPFETFEIQGPKGLLSNFTRQNYQEVLKRAIDYIFEGEIFQVNLAQHLFYPQKNSNVSLYKKLRERNPAPFAAFYEPKDSHFVLASASPERFIELSPAGKVETRPIKGTRPRSRRPEEDCYSRDALRESEKDRSENVMIVDLLRNDLSRVCKPFSVKVPQLFEVETYASVHHLVSVIHGELEEGRTALDLLRCTFPGGSITGAPKIRAMEIIHELEPSPRGAYCGSLGYLSFSGAMDTSILIRTITASQGWLQFPVGGGIVAGSSPPGEYEETLDKARGILWALE